MLFAANILGYQHEIQTGKGRRIHLDGDSYEWQWSSPHLVAKFIDGFPTLTYAQREKARSHFDRRDGSNDGNYGPGYRHDGIIACMDPDVDGMVYMGVPDAFRISVFDTSTVPAEQRELFETVLLNSPDQGHTIIRIDDALIEKPFPLYDDLNPDQLIAACRLTGLSFAHVLEYEVEHGGNRDEFVEALEEAATSGVGGELLDAVLDGLATPSSGAPDGLDDLTIAQLRERAKERDLDITSTRKADFVNALREQAALQETV